MDLQYSGNAFVGLDEAHARFLRMHLELELPNRIYFGFSARLGHRRAPPGCVQKSTN